MAVVGLSVLALWVEDQPAKIVAALERPTSGASPMGVGGSRESPPSDKTTEGLPPQLEALQIEAARRDIFVPVEPPAPKVVPPAPAPVAPPPPPPTPMAPPMSWRYLGAMVTPAGQRLVMLAKGDTNVTIQAGTQLDEGYVVEAIGADAVRLVYPPLGTVVDLPIPPAPPSPR
jgi:hypothetical protein